MNLHDRSRYQAYAFYGHLIVRILQIPGLQPIRYVMYGSSGARSRNPRFWPYTFLSYVFSVSFARLPMVVAK